MEILWLGKWSTRKWRIKKNILLIHLHKHFISFFLSILCVLCYFFPPGFCGSIKKDLRTAVGIQSDRVSLPRCLIYQKICLIWQQICFCFCFSFTQLFGWLIIFFSHTLSYVKEFYCWLQSPGPCEINIKWWSILILLGFKYLVLYLHFYGFT